MGALQIVTRIAAVLRGVFSSCSSTPVAPAPCARCLANEAIVQAKDAEIARATAREASTDAHLRRLEAQVAALADTRAAAVAARIAGPVDAAAPPKERVLRKPHLPAFAAQLVANRQISPDRLRALALRKIQTQGLPPVAR
jgi:hypothetical protein